MTGQKFAISFPRSSVVPVRRLLDLSFILILRRRQANVATAPATIKNANPATSLGYTNYFYAQLDDDLLHGYNITWGAENTTIDAGSEFIVGSTPGISGTHFSVSAIPNPGGGNNIIVFYQAKGNDVTEYTRDLVAGQWSSVNIQIPPQ